MGWDVSVEDAGNLGSWMTSAAVTGGDALNSVSVAAKRVDELGLDFEGQTADAVKNYWTQVHGCMLSAIGAALTQLTASYAEYYNELAEIDGDAYARFVQDEIIAGMKKASDTSPIFTEVDGNMRGTLGSVSDIISVTEPSINEITAGLAAMAQDASDLEENVNSTEASGSSKAAAAGELITKAEDFLEQIESGSASGGMSYVPTEFFTTQTSKDLLNALDTFSASAYGNGEYVNKQISAMSNDTQARAQTRFEDAKRASERQALLKVVAGIGVVVAGAACIVATAGAATPAVAMAGAALGGTTAVFGVSDAVEGVQDTYKAFTAQNWEDLNSRSFNFTRDIFFGGDEEKYKSFENELITACALAAPVAKGTTAFAGALEAGGSLSGAALSGSGAAVRCYLSSKVMGAVDSQVINPVLSNLVGGGEIGELVVGIKDVAMGVRGLRKSMASHKNGEHVSVKETSQDVKDVKISSSKAGKFVNGIGIKGAKTSSDDSHLPSGYEQVDAPVDCVNLPKDTWNADTAFERGNIIDKALGNNTGHNYPKIDHFDSETGNATSVKSLDTGAKSYQSYGQLHSKLNSYIKTAASYDGNERQALPDGSVINSNMIKSRELRLVVPDKSLTKNQIRALNAAKADADAMGVKLSITIGK